MPTRYIDGGKKEIMPRIQDIPKFTKICRYHVTVSWGFLREHITHQQRLEDKEAGLAILEMNPDFQRGHVWSEEQQIAYVEFKLRGGSGANHVYFNCTGWNSDYRGPYVLVDGLQRITAVLAFLNNEIKAFGYYLSEYEDPRKVTSGISDLNFIFNVNDLETYDEVLRWYLEMNEGGTPHTKQELDKVRTLLGGNDENNK